MFKSRRPAMRRCRENERFVMKNREKRSKLEGISNITSNRVTIPPEFLYLGGKVVGAQSRRRKEGFNPNPDFISTKDPHEVLNDNFNEYRNRPRRSARISTKSDETHGYENLTASEYYCKAVKSQKSDQTNVQPAENSQTSRAIVRNNSKSLFREINERFAKSQAKDFSYPISAILEPHSKVQHLYPTGFCFNLSREVSLDLQQQDYVLDAKLAVAERIRDVNQQLQGKTNSRKATPKRDEKMDVNEDPKDFCYVPRHEWIFKTPPRQGVAPPRAEECPIQPAVICTARKRSNIYELNTEMDLTGFSNRQNVPVDMRFMRHVASFEEKTGGDLEVASSSYRDAGNEGVYSNPVPQFFSQVVARPIKTVKKSSRCSKFYARRSDGDRDGTPTGPDSFQSVEEFERDMTFVEDNGTFKLVNTQASTGGDPFQIKFLGKNLFKGADDKMFNFDKKESKMFDFSKLGEN